jgi:hypothetical protein
MVSLSIRTEGTIAKSLDEIAEEDGRKQCQLAAPVVSADGRVALAGVPFSRHGLEENAAAPRSTDSLYCEGVIVVGPSSGRRLFR